MHFLLTMKMLPCAYQRPGWNFPEVMQSPLVAISFWGSALTRINIQFGDRVAGLCVNAAPVVWLQACIPAVCWVLLHTASHIPTLEVVYRTLRACALTKVMNHHCTPDLGCRSKEADAQPCNLVPTDGYSVGLGGSRKTIQCVYVCASMLTWRHVCIFEYVCRNLGRPGMSSFISFHLVLLRQDLSLNWELAVLFPISHSGCSASKFQQSSCLYLIPSAGIIGHAWHSMQILGIETQVVMLVQQVLLVAEPSPRSQTPKCMW